MKNGDYIILCSNLILLEVIDVTRRKVCLKEKYDPVNPVDSIQIQNKIGATIKNILSKIISMQNDGKVQIVGSTCSHDDFCKNTVDLSQTIIGVVQLHPKKKGAPQYIFHGVGHCDMQHALIAADTNADELATFDKDFSEISGAPKLNGTQISIYAVDP